MAEGETACPMESESSCAHAAAETSLDVVVGLGANVGDPGRTLRAAVRELTTWSPRARLSHIYRTAPVGGPSQPDFLNAALRLRFPGAPRELLERLLAVERRAGRVRIERWGPRTLDLDILWVSELTLSDSDLIIPHPRLRERAFALRPLLDVAPEASDPRDGVPYARVMAELGSSGTELLERSWPVAEM
jgi:2-amino-4-hydroxy-6-hydroxymethyldihydropteridine diphosphokinase